MYLGSQGSSMQAMSDKTALIIDEEVTSIVNSCYAKAEQLLKDNKDILENMKDALLKYETIDALQIDDLMNRVPVRAPTLDYDPAVNSNDGPKSQNEAPSQTVNNNTEENSANTQNTDAPKDSDDNNGEAR